MLACLGSVAHAAPAPGQPRMQPLWPMAGVALKGQVRDGTFCETARQAAFRLDDGAVITVDETGTITERGNSGVIAIGPPMTCDRKDRIWVGSEHTLVMLAPNRAPERKTVAVKDAIRLVRALDDDSLAIVDHRGGVYRYGATLEERWVASPPPGQLALDGSGERILTIVRDRIEIRSPTGTQIGPAANAAGWITDGMIAFADRTGKISRWAIGTPVEQAVVVAQMPPHPRSPAMRLTFARAGLGRIAVTRDFEGPLLVLAFDAAGGLASSVQHSRMPNGSRRFAFGGLPWGVLGAGARVHIVPDLAQPTFVIDHEHPLAVVDAMVFSPDGRSLAVLGGDRDVLVYGLARRSVIRRLASPATTVRGPLRWFPDGTIDVGIFGTPTRWNPDGTVEVRRRALGFTDLGHPIVLDQITRQISIDHGHSMQALPILERPLAIHEAEVTGTMLFVRAARRCELHDLRAPVTSPPTLRTKDRGSIQNAVLVAGPAIMYVDESGTLYLADAKTERVLDKRPGKRLLAAASDGQRVAFAARNALTIYDEHGTTLETLATRNEVTALAWSPDRHTLAVATKDGIDLWTFPR